MKIGDRVLVINLSFKCRGGIPEGCLLESGVIARIHLGHELPIEVLMDNEKLRSRFGKDTWVFPEDCLRVIMGEWHERKEMDLPRRSKTL